MTSSSWLCSLSPADLFAQLELHAIPTADLPGPGNYPVDVVVEEHHQDGLNGICGGKTANGQHRITNAVLVCEDDGEAVRVDIEGWTVGHLRSRDARRYRQQLIAGGNEGMPGICSAKIVGGWYRGEGDEGDYEVKLDLQASE